MGRLTLNSAGRSAQQSDINFDVNFRVKTYAGFLPTQRRLKQSGGFSIKGDGNKQGDLITVDQFDSSIGNISSR